MASVLILSNSHTRIDSCVRVVHGNKYFIARIVEDNAEWYPPFLKEEYERSISRKTASEQNSGDGSNGPRKDASSEVEKVPFINDGMDINDVTSRGDSSCDPINTTTQNLETPNDPPSPFLPPMQNSNSPTMQNPNSPTMQNISITPPILNPNTTPIFSRSKSSPSQILNPSLSRKRQRRRSPVNIDATLFDLNSPPIPNRAQPTNPYDFNTARAMHNKHTEFSSRYFPPPVSFESLLNKEFPPLFSTLNVPLPLQLKSLLRHPLSPPLPPSPSSSTKKPKKQSLLGNVSVFISLAMNN